MDEQISFFLDVAWSDEQCARYGCAHILILPTDAENDSIRCEFALPLRANLQVEMGVRLNRWRVRKLKQSRVDLSMQLRLE